MALKAEYTSASFLSDALTAEALSAVANLNGDASVTLLWISGLKVYSSKILLSSGRALN